MLKIWISLLADRLAAGAMIHDAMLGGHGYIKTTLNIRTKMVLAQNYWPQKTAGELVKLDRTIRGVKTSYIDVKWTEDPFGIFAFFFRKWCKPRFLEAYCWFMEENPVYISWYGKYIYHYLQGFIHVGRCKISSINSITPQSDLISSFEETFHLGIVVQGWSASHPIWS